jgi:prephenate dehydrogenase
MLRKNRPIAFIVGLGQIGASLGYDLMASRSFAEVIGYDKKSAVCNIARRKRAISTPVRSMVEGIASADIIILATPIRATIKLLPIVCKRTRAGQVIIDVTGTKSEIFRKLKTLNCRAAYFSCHPIAGSEVAGIAGSRKGLFKKATFVVVPHNGFVRDSLRTVTNLIRSIGAVPLTIDAKTHDRIIALTSNLPYVVALGLAELTASQAKKMPGIWNLAGGSLRSAVRVAMSSPELTFDMLSTNRTNVASGIDLMIEQLKHIQGLILSGDDIMLKRIIGRANKVAAKVHNG